MTASPMPLCQGVEVPEVALVRDGRLLGEMRGLELAVGRIVPARGGVSLPSLRTGETIERAVDDAAEVHPRYRRTWFTAKSLTASRTTMIATTTPMRRKSFTTKVRSNTGGRIAALTFPGAVS